MILAKNQDLIKAEGSEHCGSMSIDNGAQWVSDPSVPGGGWKQIAKPGKVMCPKPGQHYPKRLMTYFNYFKVDGQWLIIRGQDVEKFLSIIEVQDAMSIQGAMADPKPTRLSTQTDLIAFLRKKGIPEEKIAEHYHMNLMRGRVFKKLVNGK
jgi:hypothetical protein